MISEIIHIFKNSKKSGIILIFALLIICVCFIFLPKIFQKDIADLSEIVERGRLVVVVDDSDNGFTMRNDSIFGFEYEIIKAFSDYLGVELEITRENDTKKAIEGLKKGEYDIVAKFIPYTEETRHDDITLTQPIVKTRQMLVQRKEQKSDSINHYISTQYQLGNSTIYLPLNSFYKQRIENLMQEIADTIFIVELPDISPEMLVALVAEEKISYTVFPEIYTNRYRKMYPNLDFSLPINFTQEQCWAVNIHALHLAKEINDFVAYFQESAEYLELCRKYF